MLDTTGPAQPGQNEPTIDPDALVAVGLSAMKTAMTQFHSETGSLRAEMKRVQGMGLNTKVAKEALAIIESGDVSKKLEEIGLLFRYLKTGGAPVKADQLELFPTVGSREPLADTAKADGRMAGQMGYDSETCPHEGTTEAYRAWSDGYAIGAAERKMILDMKMDQPATDAGADEYADAIEG